nr:MAG TPA: hypothetical protein [Caudoviricetes sp.]
MAEYSREQRSKLSRTLANCETGSKQLKGFVDNRKQKVIQQQKDVRTISTGLIRSVSNDYRLQADEEFVTGNTYPLGFINEQQFRDATRLLARRYRGSEIIVSGSSVTGYQYRDPRIPFRAESDIDMGVVGTIPLGVNARGFPSGRAMRRFERDFNASMQNTIHHPTGIRFYETRPVRPIIVRPHTPEGTIKYFV